MTPSASSPAVASRRGTGDAAGISIRTTTHRHASTAVLCVCALALAASAVLPGGLATPEPAEAATKLGSAVARAAALQDRLDALSEEQAAIQLRIDDSAGKLRAQVKVVSASKGSAEAARRLLRARAVAMYKTDELDAMTVLLAADTWSDLVTRSELMARLLAEDARLLAEARQAASEAERQEQVLAGIHQEALALRRLQARRLAAARAALAEQRRLVATLSEQARRDLEARRAAAAAAKKKFAAKAATSASSIKIGPVTVLPSRQFLAPAYFPKVFATTGGSFTGLASWMGAGIDGHNTASGRRFNHNDYTCAHRSLPFGTYLAVSRGQKRVIVVVTDRGPYMGGRVLDLSQAAAKALGIDGVGTVKAEIVKPQ